jgi:hypothetical protein
MIENEQTTSQVVTLTQKIGLTVTGSSWIVHRADIADWLNFGTSVLGFIAAVWTIFNLWKHRNKKHGRSS